jgi:hypothetical protein
VEDSDGGVGAAAAMVVVNRLPTVTLSALLSAGGGGELVRLVGNASDADGGSSLPLAFSWSFSVDSRTTLLSTPPPLATFRAVGSSTAPTLRLVHQDAVSVVAGVARLPSSGRSWFAVTVVDALGGNATAFAFVDAPFVVYAGEDVLVPAASATSGAV